MSGEGVTPFTHGAHEYTRIMKTVALREALDEGGYDAAIGGARRDEERSRAKERVFSLREPGHRWEPRSSARVLATPSTPSSPTVRRMRGFPLSNWTELDVWRYIRREEHPGRAALLRRRATVVERDGQLIIVDDERFPLQDGEQPQMRDGAVPHAGLLPADRAVESTADDARRPARRDARRPALRAAGRLIDGEGGGSMESKKTEGYF